MAKINYDSINFKNKDIDKFATKFSEKKDPLKMPSNTSASESTNVKTQSFVRPSAASIQDMKNEKERSRLEERGWLEKYQEKYGKPTGRQSAG